MWNNILLNNQQVKKEIRKEKRQYLEMNESEKQCGNLQEEATQGLDGTAEDKYIGEPKGKVLSKIQNFQQAKWW